VSGRLRVQRAAPADQGQRERVRRLVTAAEGDPLAPFALRLGKSYFWSSDGRAVLDYRVRLGTAVVAGDPVGDRDQFAALTGEFIAFAERHGWRVAVLAAGEQTRLLWAAHRFGALSIGRDVIVAVNDFSLKGPRFRNLRQAVQRTHNAGVTVSLHAEADIDQQLAADLLQLRARCHKQDRGFSMLLGNLLDGTHPDALIAVAEDRSGRRVAFQRYLRSGLDGLTLDLPVRDPTAPNGVDERVIIDVVGWAREHGLQWVSLAFAPFADLHETQHRTLGGWVGYHSLRLLDPWIRVGSLYQYLRKFDAMAGQRFVLLRWRQVVPVALAMLLLEFRSTPARVRPRA